MRTSLLLLLPFLSIACQRNSEEASVWAAFLSDKTPVNVALASPAEAPPPPSNILFRSTDEGKTWEDVSATLPPDFDLWGRDAYADDHEIILSGEKGLFRSSTRTASLAWMQEVALPNEITEISSGKNGKYAIRYERGVYQEVAGTNMWRPVFPALQGKFVTCVLELPNGHLWVSTTEGILESSDSGTNWQQVYAEAPVYEIYFLDSTLLAIGEQGVLRSTDQGKHWQSALSRGGAAFTVKPVAGGIAALINGGKGPWQHFNPDGETANVLMRSTDAGKTWQPMDEALLPLGVIYHLEPIGQYLFATLDTGLFRSADGGKTWELVLSMGGRTYRAVRSGQTIFAIATNEGC